MLAAGFGIELRAYELSDGVKPVRAVRWDTEQRDSINTKSISVKVTSVTTFVLRHVELTDGISHVLH